MLEVRRACTDWTTKATIVRVIWDVDGVLLDSYCFDLASVAPHCSGATSAIDCENVQRWPAKSSAVYDLSPNGMLVGGWTIRAPDRFASSKCRSTSSTWTSTYWLTSLERGGRNSAPCAPSMTAHSPTES